MKTRLHYGYIIVACCCLIMAVNIGLTFSCAGIFYKPVSGDLGVKVGEFGIYMSIMYIASSLMLPMAGRWIERYSARWLLTGASALMGGTFLAMSQMRELWEFYVAGALLGFAVAFLLYLSFPTLINRWFNRNIGLMMGICSAASGIGGMLFNPLASVIITNLGWHWGYAIFGLFILIVVTPLLGLLLRSFPADKGLQPVGSKAAKSDAGNAAPVTDNSKTLTQASRMPVFYGILVFAFLMMACSTLNLFIPAYIQVKGFSLEAAGLAAAAVMTGVTIGKLVLGHVNDRNCSAGVLLTTVGGAVGLLLLIIGQGAWMFALFVVGTFLFGWAYAGVTVQTAMLTRTVFGSRHYASINAIISIALALGGALASGGWGLIVDATSYTTIFYIGIGMLVLCAALGLKALWRKE